MPRAAPAVAPARSRGATVALLVALALAGCFTPIPVEPGGADGSTALEPFERVLHLTPEGDLREAPAAPAVQPLGWGWFQWTSGVLPPAWRSEPAEAAMLIEGATAALTYTAMHPVTTPNVRPELTMWFGVGDSMIAHSFAEGPDVIHAGDRVTAEFDIVLPAGGLLVRPGETVVLRVGSYYNDDARQEGVALAFGDDAPASLTLRGRHVVHDEPDARLVAVEETVTLSGGRCMGMDHLSEQDTVLIPFRVADHIRGIDVRVDHVEGDGAPDIDFFVRDDAGEIVGRAVGSAGHETLHLRQANMDAAERGTWTLGVYACTLQNSRVDVHLQQLIG